MMPLSKPALLKKKLKEAMQLHGYESEASSLSETRYGSFIIVIIIIIKHNGEGRVG